MFGPKDRYVPKTRGRGEGKSISGPMRKATRREGGGLKKKKKSMTGPRRGRVKTEARSRG